MARDSCADCGVPILWVDGPEKRMALDAVEVPSGRWRLRVNDPKVAEPISRPGLPGLVLHECGKTPS